MMKRMIIVTFFLLLFLVMSVVSVFLFPGFVSDAFTPGRPAAADQPASEPSKWEALKFWSLENAGSLTQGKNKAAAADLALTITAGLDSDYDKMVAVYDWVTGNIAYDLDKAANISAYGAGANYLLETGRGVCHDYAELTKAMLTALGIEATYEKGEVIPEAGETELHAWNRVLIGETWYALDTTWGAGFILEDGFGFVQKPRRIYLTSPEELELLHNDPEYKHNREQEYLKEISLDKPVVHLSDVEQTLFILGNDYRSDQGLPFYSNENRLTGLARRYSADLAEAICVGADYSLKELSDELTRQAGDMKIKSAVMNAYSKWLYHPSVTTEFLDLVISDHSKSLSDAQWEAVAIGVTRKGDLVAIIFIFVEYH